VPNLTETLVHRYFLHVSIPQNERLHSLVRRLHYGHHEAHPTQSFRFFPSG
jgi:hypothetical protein